ncbi:MAG TPA: hypothetical protein DET40_15860 [Lentisphaeria bacterium]|nr:hypothetical protein [Lentisphaeria bacterium]
MASEAIMLWKNSLSVVLAGSISSGFLLASSSVFAEDLPVGGGNEKPVIGGLKPLEPLPISGTKEKPVVVLGFGKEPFRKIGEDPEILTYTGRIISSEGTESSNIGASEANLMRKGFGKWGAVFQFDLQSPLPAGCYNFSARFKGGGEPAWARQTFLIKAGPDERNLHERGFFQTARKASWQYSWVKDTGNFVLFPTDKVIQIVNNGTGDGAMIFNAFVFGMENPWPEWMTAEKGRLRSKFLEGWEKVENPEQWLYLVDGNGEGDKILFEGLSQDSARARFDETQVSYQLGENAEETAKWLNLPGCPAAVLVNADRKVLGVLNNPKNMEEVSAFLADPGKLGTIPNYPEIKQPDPLPLKGGAPSKWLIATGWPGHCGVGHLGLDAESQQRPNPGDPYLYGFYTSGNRSGLWEEQPVNNEAVCKITEKLAGTYEWGKCTSYAVVYLDVAEPVKAVLHLQHSGVESAVYLDGAEQPLKADASQQFKIARKQMPSGPKVVERDDNEIHDDLVIPQAAQGPLATNLKLEKGSHCLILKLVHAQDKNETVLFAARFTDAEGTALSTGLRSWTSDPTVPLGIAHGAANLWPDMTLENVPGNLPRPGEQLTLVADMRVMKSPLSTFSPGYFLPIQAKLRVRMTDYDGKEIRTYEAEGTFPDVLKIDLGKAPEAGYYALTPSLHQLDGRLIHRFHPDGFSVVQGNAAQKERVEQKELWNSWYYALSGSYDTFAPWLERTGLFKNQGSMPEVSKEIEAKWEDARKRGLVLVGDFSADNYWMNNSEKHAQEIMDLVPKYTRYFKTANEIDGRFSDESLATRTPEKWVERAKWQYEAVHKARADAVYYGGSLYCSGKDKPAKAPVLSPRIWFRECLKLGLDNYIDVWDVHAYPQYPPKLEAPSVANSNLETDLGVLDVYKELGRKNTKPFFLGETSAMVWHGFAGMRWQAATIAKMAAWTNSREDWLGIAFCAAHHNRRATGEEYALAHNPGEAAIYTAGALIDGLPYRRQKAAEAEIQAAWFGETFMIWRADDKITDWKMKLEEAGPWVKVDVVGRMKPLEVKDGQAKFQIGTSPVYVLTKENYEKLTRF